MLGSAVFAICAWTSFRRHLHVDELTALYSVQVGAFGHPEFALPVELNSALFRPLTHVLGTSERIFVGFRWLQLGLLYVLCWAISRVQRALSSEAGRGAVFLAAVLFGPLWRHGFEIRHDIFVAFLVVLLGWAAERAREGRATSLTIGATSLGAVLVQANSFKAFMLWVPGLLLCAVLAASRDRFSVRQLIAELLRFLPGLVLGAGFVAGVLASFGMLREYLDQVGQYFAFSAVPPYRLPAWPLLSFTLEHAPFHSLAVLVGVLLLGGRVVQGKSPAEALVPGTLLALSVLTLLPNPTPFPYNLTWLAVPWLLVGSVGMAGAWRWLTRLAGARRAALGVALVGLLGAACFVSTQLDPYYRRDWSYQLSVVAAAEALTTPDQPVLDLSGLVLTRPPPAKDWLVHSLFMDAYHRGRRETVRHIIERVWPPVALTNYRWSFVDRDDRDALIEYYVRFGGDVWTLGARGGSSDDRVEVHRAGRYSVSAIGTLRVDERDAQNGEILTLNAGTHSLASGGPWALSWAGAGASPSAPRFGRLLFEPSKLAGQ